MNVREHQSKSRNTKMQDAIRDCLMGDRPYFFSVETMKFWGSRVEQGMFKNNTFVTSEDNFDRSKRLYTARKYDWKNHSVETIGEFQQFENLDEAIAFAKAYKEEEQ